MKNLPVYRLNAFLLMILLIIAFLYYAKDFLIPLLFAILLSMLLMPACRKLESWGVSRVGSTFLGLGIILAFLAGIIWIIIAQGQSISEDWPKMAANAEKIFDNIQSWINTRYGIPPGEQSHWLGKGIQKIGQSGGAIASGFFSGLMGIITSFVLTMLYFFFLMWKREKFGEFLLKLVAPENRKEVAKELEEIRGVSEKYLIGRLISMSFLAIFYMIGFSIAGLENALLVALVAILPTIVPYVGSFVGAIFPLAIALVSGNQDLLLPIGLILIAAQVIDNNIIEPLVEGESLDISPIFTIIALVLGEMFWGVAGMILFVPMFAILKIVCDHIPALHPYSFLLQNEIDEPKWITKIRGYFSKKKRRKTS